MKRWKKERKKILDRFRQATLRWGLPYEVIQLKSPFVGPMTIRWIGLGFPLSRSISCYSLLCVWGKIGIKINLLGSLFALLLLSHFTRCSILSNIATITFLFHVCVNCIYHFKANFLYFWKNISMSYHNYLCQSR